MFRKTALNPQFIKLLMVKGADSRRHSWESPDQAELRGEEVNDKPEPGFLRERKTMLGFALRLGKRVARREEVGVQLVAAVGRVSEITDLIGYLECAAHQIATVADMFPPPHDEMSAELQSCGP